MSFANEWLRYLEKSNFLILNTTLKGKRPEDMKQTEITVKGEEVRQFYPYRKGSKLPDQITFPSLKTEKVEIETSDGFTFYISENKDMKIKFVNYSGFGLDSKVEKNIIKEAKKLGYNVIEVEIFDI